jgi:hypothetical protein
MTGFQESSGISWVVGLWIVCLAFFCDVSVVYTRRTSLLYGKPFTFHPVSTSSIIFSVFDSQNIRGILSLSFLRFLLVIREDD